ncbi:hypothetical protein ACFLY1_00345 [Patescibacteria group bacterium]
MKRISNKYHAVSFICAVCIIAISTSFCFAEYKPLLPEKIFSVETQDVFDKLIIELLILEELKRPAVLEELINPKFTSKDEIKKRVVECKKIERSLMGFIRKMDIIKEFDKKQKLAGELALAVQIKKLVMNYIDFAHEWRDETTDYIGNSMAVKIPKNVIDRKYIIQDVRASYESMLKKWKELGLNVTEGYIYVKVFSSQKSFDAFLNQEKKDEKAGGITFASRFIALPWTSSEKFKNTLEHEIVHVFVNNVRPIGGESISEWWSEGLATYLSDNLGAYIIKHSVKLDEKGNGVATILKSHTDEDYMMYKGYFEYLVAEYGKDKFASFISESTKNSVPEALKSEFGINSEQQFILQATKWKKEQSGQNDWLLIAVSVGLLASLFVAVGTSGSFILLWSVFMIAFVFVLMYYQQSIYYRYYLFILAGSLVTMNIVGCFVRTINREKEMRRLEELRNQNMDSEEEIY